jgi:hypothetical protein
MVSVVTAGQTLDERVWDFLESCATEAAPVDWHGLDLQALAEILASTKASAQPVAVPDLVGRPAETDLWSWHLQCLLDCLPPGPGSDPAARRIFHARWLLHMLQPDNERADLCASIVIPVYNRAGLVVEAVESALNQTYSSVEVIVVDDGSSDHPDLSLQPYLSRIQYFRQPNRGVACARNRGIVEARGEYVCFLDSDNLLDPDAVKLWLDMFHAVPDAELCFAVPREVVMGELALVRNPYLVADGSPACATQNLARAAGRLFTAGVLVPRFLVTEAGGFDERLPKGEDTRLWFQLGLRGIKAVAVSRPLSTRRLFPGSLSDDPFHASHGRGRTALLNIADLLERPEHWNLMGRVIGELTDSERWEWVCRSEEAIVIGARVQFVKRLEELRACGQDFGLSERPVLRLLRGGLEKAEARLWPQPEQIPAYHASVIDVIDRLLADSSPPGPVDIDYWHRDPTLFDSLEPALECLRVSAGA